MEGIGFLSGDVFHSEATGISADGRFIVGSSSIAESPELEAFRWSDETDMVSLGGIAGYAFSAAAAVSGSTAGDHAATRRLIASSGAQGGVQVAAWQASHLTLFLRLPVRAPRQAFCLQASPRQRRTPGLFEPRELEIQTALCPA